MAKVRATAVFAASFEGRVYALAPGEETDVPQGLADKLEAAGYVDVLSPKKAKVVEKEPEPE